MKLVPGLIALGRNGMPSLWIEVVEESFLQTVQHLPHGFQEHAVFRLFVAGMLSAEVLQLMDSFSDLLKPLVPLTLILHLTLLF